MTAPLPDFSERIELEPAGVTFVFGDLQVDLVIGTSD
jgi:hypothetical protein